MKTILLALGFLTVSLPLSARLGDTREKCNWRYGEPVPVDAGDDGLAWANGSYIIIARFHAGLCDRISYKRLDKKPMEPDEMAPLLAANGGKQDWDALPATGDGISALVTKDYTALASYEASSLTLYLQTNAAFMRRKAESEAPIQAAKPPPPERVINFTPATGAFQVDGGIWHGTASRYVDGSVYFTEDTQRGTGGWVRAERLSPASRCQLGIGTAQDARDAMAAQEAERARVAASQARERAVAANEAETRAYFAEQARQRQDRQAIQDLTTAIQDQTDAIDDAVYEMILRRTPRGIIPVMPR